MNDELIEGSETFVVIIEDSLNSSLPYTIITILDDDSKKITHFHRPSDIWVYNLIPKTAGRLVLNGPPFISEGSGDHQICATLVTTKSVNISFSIWLIFEVVSPDAGMRQLVMCSLSFISSCSVRPRLQFLVPHCGYNWSLGISRPSLCHTGSHWRPNSRRTIRILQC